MRNTKNHKYIWFFLGLLLLLLSPLASRAQLFLVSEGNSFVDQEARQRRVGIEIEFKGLTDLQITELVKQHYPDAQVTGTILTGLQFETSIGTIKLIIEGQAYKYENDPVKFKAQQQLDILNAPRELVFPPVTFEEIPRMQELFTALKENGAKGTSKDRAVSLQVNLEMRPLTSRKNVKYVLDMMRNYYNPEHRAQIEGILNIPENRLPYIQNPTDGFLKKLKDPAYSPTPREFYDDFMYRQSLEVLGHRDAWTMDIESAKKRLLAYEGESAVVPRVMKMNKLRVSSLLLLAFPDDALTKRVIASRWARPMPAVEVREFNNDFDVTSKARWVLGLARGAEMFGAYSHDKLFSDLTGVSEADIRRIRQGLASGKKSIRYVLQSPTDAALTSEDREWLRRYNQDVIQIQLSPDKIGTIPLVLGNGSVVWHRRNIHRTTILGEFNPGLENALLQQALENKLVEALVFTKYAPGSFPKTIPLLDLPGAKDARIVDLVKSMSQRFPNGWVLKGAWDLSSEKIIITDKTDFKLALKDYKNGFEAYKQKVLTENAGADPELIVYQLKKHPGFLGSKIIQLLEDRNLLLVQERRQLVEEFRVEIIGGKVLGKGSTIPRYAYMSRKKVTVHPVFFNQAESFAQNIINQLPAELKALPYALDVALTKEGDWIVIETNPGGNSSFLEENPKSSRALVEYLRNYRPVQQGLLSLSDQVKWIKRHLSENNLQAEKMYPGIDIGADSFNDKAYPKTLQRPELDRVSSDILQERLPINNRGQLCPKIFSH